MKRTVFGVFTIGIKSRFFIIKSIMKSGNLLAVGTAEEIKEKAGCSDFESAFVAIVKEGTL